MAHRPKIGARAAYRKQIGNGAMLLFSHPSRPALRGGVTGGEPPLYPAQKSNLWIALGGPGLHSATEAHRRPTPRFTGWRGTGAITRSGGPQRRLKRLTRGRCREGRPLVRNGPLRCPFDGSHRRCSRGSGHLLRPRPRRPGRRPRTGLELGVDVGQLGVEPLSQFSRVGFQRTQE